MADDSDVASVQSDQSIDKKACLHSFYALYSYNSNREANIPSGEAHSRTDKDEGNNCLSILSTDLTASSETELRKYLAQRLSKSPSYSGSGTIVTLDFSVTDESSVDSAACYFCVQEVCYESHKTREDGTDGGSSQTKLAAGDTAVPTDETTPSNSTQYVICFISTQEDALDLFRPELDEYSMGVLQFLDSEHTKQLREAREKEASQSDDGKMKMSQIDTSVRDYLQVWHEESMDYLCVCLKTLQNNVKYLVFNALLGTQLIIDGGSEELKGAIYRFAKACSLSDILQQLKSEKLKRESSPLSGSMDMLVEIGRGDNIGGAHDSSSPTVTLHITDESVRFDNEDCTQFCEEWGKALNKVESENAARLRQVIEAFKLKFIQSINTLKRLLKQAENDYYALYRSYVFLKNSGNSNVLLHYTRLEVLPEVTSVLRSLEEFMQEMAVA